MYILIYFTLPVNNTINVRSTTRTFKGTWDEALTEFLSTHTDVYFKWHYNNKFSRNHVCKFIFFRYTIKFIVKINVVKDTFHSIDWFASVPGHCSGFISECSYRFTKYTKIYKTEQNSFPINA